MALKVDISGTELVEAAIPLRESWEKDIRELFLQILADEGLDVDKDNFYISVSFVSSGEMRELNRLYRDIDAPTDVLSFPLWEDMELPEGWGEIALGDIVIAPDVVKENASNSELFPDRELFFVLAHGLLHLLGWDHQDEETESTMIERQEQYLERIF
ncbi:rRNA maturation RNase YbeY [Acetomicrobium sp. S15 = DSM 107314]|uniref:rRNA maturation RNase YbeY n=1 Tax=Acetomicrobium sp. S15 = DSM 107314 TaxID=2529858 RepID=UPI0018E14C99|nr:rRNA maturation RNase YbeY [Acetomicrobium sp. S15 = DSM 107314]